MTQFKMPSPAILALGLICAGTPAGAAPDSGAYLKDRTIAYVLTHRDWGVYQTAGAKDECPDGQAEWGPREQFKTLFLQDGKKRTYEEAQLKQESDIHFPNLEPDRFPYREVTGKIAYGLNLDGKVGPNDFTSPDGETGIDNQLYRVIGCNDIFRGPTGIVYDISNQYLRNRNYNRVLIELTEVDSLADDNDVVVTIQRGRDGLLMDGTGKRVIPGGTQRLDTRWSKRFVQRLHGKIVNGVLTTEAADITIPYAVLRPAEETYLGGRLQLKLTPQSAEGVLGGYMNVEDWYHGLSKNWATVFQSYGRMASQSMYKKLRPAADGYPDPQTGENTAISAAAQLWFTQVFVQHPEKQVAATPVDATARKTEAAR
jgi:hypothetical protein